MRRTIIATTLVMLFLGMGAPTLVSAETTTTSVPGTSIDSGLFVTVFDQPVRLFAALVLPTVLVFLALLALVWFRRGMRR